MNATRYGLRSALGSALLAATLAAAPPTTQPVIVLPVRHEPVLPPPMPAPTPPAPTAPAPTPPAPTPPVPQPPAASQPTTTVAPPKPAPTETRPAVEAPPPKPVPAPAASQPATPPPPIQATAPLPVPDAVSYWAGLSAGRRIRARLAEDGRGFDDGVVLKGIIDGLADRNPAYPRADAQSAFDQLQANVLQRRAEKRAADDPTFRRLADDNAQHSRDLLARNAKMPDVRVRPDGVQVRTLHEGTGRPVAAAKTISARLSVALLDGTLLSTADHPVKLILNDALPGLTDAARTMRIGDHWQIVLPPDKGYGLAGDPPMIGPNQALVYDVEVVEVE